MVYYDPYITGQYNPLYNLTNQGFCSLLDCVLPRHLERAQFSGKSPEQNSYRVLKGWGSEGRGNWGTLRIPAGKIGEH